MQVATCGTALRIVFAAVGLISAAPVASAPQTSSGTIAGRIIFKGTPPAPSIQETGSQPVLYLDRSGGLQYAVVFLSSARASRDRDAAVPPATMEQRDFRFEPQVLAVRAGQVVRFTNADTANHNVRAQDAAPANMFNISTAPGAVGPSTRSFVSTGDRPIRLSCDIHPWMAAWIYVFDDDLVAVTAGDGAFRIQSVPAGQHRVAIRQPAGGLARDLTVDVRAHETTRLDVLFTDADLRTPQADAGR